MNSSLGMKRDLKPKYCKTKRLWVAKQLKWKERKRTNNQLWIKYDSLNVKLDDRFRRPGELKMEIIYDAITYDETIWQWISWKSIIDLQNNSKQYIFFHYDYSKLKIIINSLTPINKYNSQKWKVRNAFQKLFKADSHYFQINALQVEKERRLLKINSCNSILKVHFTRNSRAYPFEVTVIMHEFVILTPCWVRRLVNIGLNSDNFNERFYFVDKAYHNKD